MRSPRLRSAGIVTLVLLGALVGTTAAQELQGTATHVNGRSPGGRVVLEGTQNGVVNGVRGAVYEHAIDWSDTRLPTLMRVAPSRCLGMAYRFSTAVAAASSAFLPF